MRELGKRCCFQPVDCHYKITTCNNVLFQWWLLSVAKLKRWSFLMALKELISSLVNGWAIVFSMSLCLKQFFMPETNGWWVPNQFVFSCRSAQCTCFCDFFFYSQDTPLPTDIFSSDALPNSYTFIPSKNTSSRISYGFIYSFHPTCWSLNWHSWLRNFMLTANIT